MKKNSISFTKFLDELGCHLRLGYYWSAASEDEKRVVCTIWDDQLKNNEYLLLDGDSPRWMSLPGAHELKHHVQLALSGEIEVLGVSCHAVDPEADRREREYYDEITLLVLRLEQRGKNTVATVVGEVSSATAKTGKIHGKYEPISSAIDDLDEIPQGENFPKRVESSGSVIKRDRMVRDYVIGKANGCCEYCGEEGFPMPSGRRYLEAHHIVALGNDGPDTVANVIALCARHHREAHFGSNALRLNQEMVATVNRRSWN